MQGEERQRERDFGSRCWLKILLPLRPAALRGRHAVDDEVESQNSATPHQINAIGPRCGPSTGERDPCLTLSQRSSCRSSCCYIANPNEDTDEQTTRSGMAGVLLRPVPDNELVRQSHVPAMRRRAPTRRPTSAGSKPTPRSAWSTGHPPGGCLPDQTRVAGRDLPASSSGHAQGWGAPERDRASSCSGARRAAATDGSESFIQIGSGSPRSKSSADRRGLSRRRGRRSGGSSRECLTAI